MSGYLDKRGKFNKAWKKRFCVLLDDGIFEYYAQCDDPRPKGRILVNEIKSLGAGISLPNREVFHVVTKDRTWIFAAEDDRTRDLWIHRMEDFGKTDLMNSPFFSPIFPDTPTFSNDRQASSCSARVICEATEKRTFGGKTQKERSSTSSPTGTYSRRATPRAKKTSAK